MSSIETNNIKVPPPKPFRRRLSFRTKPTSSPEPSTNPASNTLGNGFNSVRGSIRRLRRVSTTANQNANNDPNLTQEQAATSPTFPSFQRFREQTSRLKDINLTQKIVELTTAVQEMGSETVEFGSLAKEAVVERWKKRKEEPSNGLSSSHNSSSKNVAGINIFEAPLITAVRLTRIEKDINQIENDPSRYWLPAVMVRCIEFLDIYGLEEIGLYRIPGSALTVMQMKNIFDSGADLNFLQSSAKDPHAVATLLKTYLRELPEPILTDALLPEFNACIAKHTNSAVVATPAITPGSVIPTTSSFTAPTIVPEELPRALSGIVSNLPPQNFYLLRALCSHLSRVDKKSGINKMNLSNLGVVFCPSLGIGSILFKTLIQHIDIVFGIGCKTESETLEGEKKEQEAKERMAPKVYHKTNISDEFSKSFDDLLSLDAERVNCHSSNHSYPSSSSSSIIGLYLNKDIDNLSNENNNTINNATSTITTVSPTLSSSSSITSPPTPPFKPIKSQKRNNNSKDMNNPFSSDEFLSSINIPSNNYDKRQRTVNIIDTAKTTSSSKPPFRMRSRSTGLRNVPLTAFDYSSDSSEEEEKEKEKEKEQEQEQEKKEMQEKSDISSPFMTFDYLDKHGIKNSGVLNLSPRPNWVLHHNGVGGDRSRATAAWVKRRERRPSLEETEEWKKMLLANINTTEPPNVIVDDEKDAENLANGRSKKVGKSKVRDQILKFNGMI